MPAATAARSPKAPFSRGFTPAARRAGGPAPGFDGARHGLNDYTGWFAGDAEHGAATTSATTARSRRGTTRSIHHYVFTLYALDGRARCRSRAASPAPQLRAGDRRATSLAEATAFGNLHAQSPAARLVSAHDAATAQRRRRGSSPCATARPVWNAEMRMQGQLDTAAQRARPLAGGARRRGARRRGHRGDRRERPGARARHRAGDRAASSACRIATDAGPARARLRRLRGLHLRRDRHALARRRRRAGARHDPAFAPEGGETLVEFYARAVAAVTRSPRARARRIDRSSSPTAACSTACTAPPSRVGARRAALVGARQRQRSTACSTRRERFTLVGWSDTAHLDGATLDDASEGDCATVRARRVERRERRCRASATASTRSTRRRW